MAITNKQKQVKEIIRCGKDPVYFMQKYVKIQHPTRGLIPFETYPFQEDCVGDFENNRFNIILKSRQLGLSTLSASYALWMGIFQRDKNILVIATKLNVAMNFIRKVKTMLRSLPKWLVLPEVVADNKQTIEFSHGSVIKAIPTSDDAGRSEALSLLIVDEAAFVKNFDTLWMGLYPTLSTGGRAIVLSTPNGVGGQYYKLYTDATQGENEFNPINLPWSVHPEREEEWFQKETRNMSKRQIAQELLCDFVASGETFLNSDNLDWIREATRDPLGREHEDRNLWIWEYPKTGHSYIISADVARGDSKDYSTCHVIDIEAGEISAEYRGKIPPDRFGEFLDHLGRRYNNALLAPENNTFGYTTVMKLKDLKYPNVYYAKNRAVYLGNYSPERNDQVGGFSTQGQSRLQILSKLEENIRNKSIKIYSARLYEELKSFVWKGQKAQALNGHNDDLVMSLAIGAWLYDGMMGGNQGSQDLSKAIISGMSMSSRSKDDIVHSPAHRMPQNPFTPIKQEQWEKGNKSFDKKKGYGWLLD
tara:strand:- start:8998 stop:10596 length:1599 start_codon:yes stop_codon:yes gene_type:complete